MSKFRTSILIVGMLIIIAAASLLTVFALYMTDSVVTEKTELIYTVFDAEKEYDGTPLLPQHYILSSGELRTGHYAEVDFKGAQTDTGESKSSLLVKICDKDGFDVTSDYKIRIHGGNLKVTPKTIAVRLEDEEVMYSGTTVTFEDYTVTEGELVPGHRIIGSQRAQLITVSDSLPDDLEPLVFDTAGNDVTKNYIVSFSMGTIRVVPRPVTVKPADIIKTYDGVAESVGEIEIVDGSLAEGQYFKNIEINNGITNFSANVCDIVTRITKIAIYQRQGSKEIDVTENYLLDYISETGIFRIDKRPLTVSAISGSWEYNGGDWSFADDHSLLSSEGLVDGERITRVDYTGSIRDVGEEINFISKLYFTDNTSEDNYDITYIHGTLTVTKRNLTILTPTVTKVYDGKPLKGVTEEDLPTGVNLLPEHELAVNESTLIELTDCDKRTNIFTCKVVDIYDTSENKTDLSGNYNITYYYGDISVTPRTAYVVTRDVKQTFDGATHYGYESLEDLEYSNLLEGHNLVLPESDDIPHLKEVDRILNTVTVIVEDEDGNDVSKNYTISYQLGILEIVPLNITITTRTDTRVYDGTEFKRGESYTDFGILDSLPKLSHELVDDPKNYLAITNVGEIVNYAVYKIVYADGEAVDGKNYTLEHVYGTLSITPYAVSLNLNPLTIEYLGKKYEMEEELKAQALVGNDDQFDDVLFPKNAIDLFIVDEDPTDVGTYTYTAELKGTYANGNYLLELTGGELTIIKRKVVIDTLPKWDPMTKSQEFQYNGEEHFPEKMLVVDEGVLGSWLGLNDLEFEVIDGDGINVREEVYYYTFKLASEERANNVDLICENGSYKVIQCPVIVKYKKISETYSGNEYILNWANLITEVSCGYADLQRNPTEYLEIYCGETVKNAKEYDYTLRFTSAEAARNFRLVKDAASADAQIVISKIEVITFKKAGVVCEKVYDQKLYELSTDEVGVRRKDNQNFTFTYSVDCATTSAWADEYQLRVTGGNIFFSNGEEDITENIDVVEAEPISVTIARRKITFVLDNYFCTSNTKPRDVTGELANCLHVSASTPLFNGFYIEFSWDIIYYIPSRGTIEVEEMYLSQIIIRNERGDDVTDNFFVTNEEGLIAAVIVIG